MPKPKLDQTRRCIATGEALVKHQMIRFVVGPDDEILPDVAEKLSGRGIWLRADPDALRKAIAKKLFSRSAKFAVKISDDLPDLVVKLMMQRALNYLGLAQRAGELNCGFEKVKSILTRGQAAVLLGACDGSEDGRKKLRSLASGSNKPLPVVDMFSSIELGLALGRENVIHVVLSNGGLAEKFKRECERLTPFLCRRQFEKIDSNI